MRENIGGAKLSDRLTMNLSYLHTVEHFAVSHISHFIGIEIQCIGWIMLMCVVGIHDQMSL